MVQQSPLADAVQAAISASAHAAALDHLSAATDAVRRLGSLTSGRWRTAARDLEKMEEDLQRSLDGAAAELTRRSSTLGVEEEALWTVGDAAGTMEMLRDAALEEMDEDGEAARLLRGDLLFGAAFLEDPDTESRGTTLLFGWTDPLQPAVWHWEANWVQAGGDEDGEDGDEELDLYETAELEASEPLLVAAGQVLSRSGDDVRRALTEIATALTRASMLADDAAEDDAPDESENGHRSL